jgi:hypothetical protein
MILYAKVTFIIHVDTFKVLYYTNPVPVLLANDDALLSRYNITYI